MTQITTMVWLSAPRSRHPVIQSQVGLRKPCYKANGGDGIPAELFQILKDDAVKVMHFYVSQFGKLSSGHWKKSVFNQSQRRAMPNNVQTTTQLHLSPMLAK